MMSCVTHTIARLSPTHQSFSSSPFCCHRCVRAFHNSIKKGRYSFLYKTMMFLLCSYHWPRNDARGVEVTNKFVVLRICKKRTVRHSLGHEARILGSLPARMVKCPAGEDVWGHPCPWTSVFCFVAKMSQLFAKPRSNVQIAWHLFF